MIIAIYLLVIGVLSLGVLFCITFLIFSLWGDFKGAPFVPTPLRVVREILKEARLKKGSRFIDLGCGDGRLVREAVRVYKVRGQGIELNYLLVLYSKFVSRIQKLDSASFFSKDLFSVDISRADVVFFFLMPRTVERLKEKLLKEGRRGSLIISHGFKIKGWKEVKRLDADFYSTYFYRLPFKL